MLILVKKFLKYTAGEIAAAVGLKNTTTADTLCDEKNPVIMKGMEFPLPVIDEAIEPKSQKMTKIKWHLLFKNLLKKTQHSNIRLTMKQVKLLSAGMGELHLDVLVDRMRREFNVEC